jgi:hypothetical protein
MRPLAIAAFFLAAQQHAQPAQARKAKRKGGGLWCDTHYTPLPAPVGRALPPLAKVGKAVANEVCAYLGAKPPVRRLSLDRWTTDVDTKLGPLVQSIEKARYR